MPASKDGWEAASSGTHVLPRNRISPSDPTISYASGTSRDNFSIVVSGRRAGNIGAGHTGQRRGGYRNGGRDITGRSGIVTIEEVLQ